MAEKLKRACTIYILMEIFWKNQKPFAMNDLCIFSKNIECKFIPYRSI